MRLHIVLAQVISNSRTYVDRHNPHRHIKRCEDLAFKLFCQIQPRAGESPGGIRRKRRIGKNQQKRAYNHKRHRRNKTVANGHYMSLRRDAPGDRTNVIFNKTENHVKHSMVSRHSRSPVVQNPATVLASTPPPRKAHYHFSQPCREEHQRYRFSS